MLEVLSLANNLDPDQDRQNVGPDLAPNCLGKKSLKKVSRRQNA